MSDERYEFVKAIVENGSLRWEYRLEGSTVTTRMTHDEDVSGWEGRDIRQTTYAVLNVEVQDYDRVIVEYR